MTEQSGQAVVVAVDGSEANAAALEWAITEAERTGAPLVVATVAEPFPVVGPHVDPVPPTDYVQPIADEAVAKAAERLGTERVSAQVRFGHPVTVLRELGEGQRLLVVGKRGMGAFGRLLLGSTSIAVAGRAHVTVVVVPDEWDGASATGPVVVGVDLDKEHRSSLEQAFAAASALGVPLKVLQVWEPHPAISVDAALMAASLEAWRTTATGALEALVGAVGEQFPDVEVRIEQDAGQPARLLLEASDDAQLLVLGREAKERISGFALGSVARGVLHQSEVPVVIVPAGDNAE